MVRWLLVALARTIVGAGDLLVRLDPFGGPGTTATRPANRSCRGALVTRCRHLGTFRVHPVRGEILVVLLQVLLLDGDALEVHEVAGNVQPLQLTIDGQLLPDP